MSVAEYNECRAVSPTVREKIRRNNQPPSRPAPNKGDATVVPFPASAQTGHIKKQLVSVKDYDDFAAWKWLASVVSRHESRLKKCGIAPDLIEADVHALKIEFGLSS
jgi:hypothetical protein